MFNASLGAGRYLAASAGIEYCGHAVERFMGDDGGKGRSWRAGKLVSPGNAAGAFPAWQHGPGYEDWRVLLTPAVSTGCPSTAGSPLGDDAGCYHCRGETGSGVRGQQ